MNSPLEDLVDDLTAERDWLLFFYQNADFGPAHEDVVAIIREAYEKQGGVLPPGYRSDED